jgi:mannan endo-1,4-beta-mannosidase
MIEHFVQVRGTQLTVNGSPYHFAGTNMWFGCYLGSPGPTGRRERLCRELDLLAAHGITNIRIMASSESSALSHAVRPPMMRAAEDIDEDLLCGLDFLLHHMAERDMRAVLYLTNFWGWSGGMSSYNVWATGDPGINPEQSGQTWTAFVDSTASFYANTRAQELYRAQIHRLVTRMNSLTGRIYADDPTIMAWQLANEPRPGASATSAERNLPHMIRWIDATAAYIHSLDPNHLVSTGSEGTEGCLGSDTHFLSAHASRHVDYLTFHLWPYNWRWFDPLHPEETLPGARDRSRIYVDRHVHLARRLGKPLVLEEFGLSRDGGAVDPESPTEARDSFFAFLSEVMYDSARSGSPLAGSNFWTWGGEAHTAGTESTVSPEEPHPGDPPREPQGFNSIYDTDAPTLEIIRAHAFNMQSIAGPLAIVSSQSPPGAV